MEKFGKETGVEVAAAVRRMLAENERRRGARAFEAESGAGAPAERVEVEMDCAVLGCRKLWLPKSMMKTVVGESVIRNRGVGAFARERGLAPERVGELFELVRLRHDFAYWASKYGVIRPKRGGENAPLLLNSAQRKLIGELEAMRNGGLPIRVILLKARQWGGSTAIQVYMVWLQLVVGVGLNSLIVAHQNAATEEIRAMMKRVVDSYPEDLLGIDFEAAGEGRLETRWSAPKKKSSRRKSADDDDEGEAERKSPLKAVGRSGNSWHLAARNCDFKIGTAERPDSSRGGSYSLIHLSEVGIWRSTEGKKPGEIVVSATSGILAEPGTMIVLESTAKGKGTYFHREYMAARRGEAQWRPVFVAWFDIEQYEQPLDDPESFAAELFAKRDDTESGERFESGAYLWKLWEAGATLEAINWYVWERRKYDNHSDMASEYPSDDDEAFASSGSPVFSRDMIEKIKRDVMDGEIRKSGPGVRFEVEKWSPCFMGRKYIGVLQVGASETGRRTTALVADVTRPEAPRVVAEMRGPADYIGAVEAVTMLCGEYGDCELAVVSNSGNTLESGHTNYVVERLKERWPYIYRPNRSGYIFEIDNRGRIAMTDILGELVREGRWREPSREAAAQFETLEADGTDGYRPVCGASDDLLTIRALTAYIATCQ